MAQEIEYVPSIIEKEHSDHIITGVEFYKKIVSLSNDHNKTYPSERDTLRHIALTKYCAIKIREFINPRTAKHAILKYLFDGCYIMNNGTVINDFLMTYKEAWERGIDLRSFINNLKKEGLVNFSPVNWPQSTDASVEEIINSTNIHISLTHKGEEFITKNNNMTNNTINNYGTYNNAPNGNITINNENAKDVIGKIISYLENKDLSDKEFMLMIAEKIQNGEKISKEESDLLLTKGSEISSIGALFLQIAQMTAGA